MIGVLAALGPGAAPHIRALFQKTELTPLKTRYARIKLIEAIGLSGDKGSAAFLMDVLTNNSLSPLRVEAAHALGQLRLRGLRKSLKELVGKLDPEHRRAEILAIGYTLARFGDPDGRKLLDIHFVVPKTDIMRWDIVKPAIRAAGALRLKNLRSRVEDAAKRGDPYTRFEAVRALGLIRDRGAIPVLIGSLRDKRPGVRSEALKSLRSLTGYRHKYTYEQWHRWWTKEGQETKTKTAPK